MPERVLGDSVGVPAEIAPRHSGSMTAKHTLWLVLLSFFVVVVLVLNPTDLWAQNKQVSANLLDLSLEDLLKIDIDSVYGASKHEQKVTEAPASVTIITSEEIQKYGYRTLADILRNVRGFYVTSDRNYSFVGVRGFGRPGDYNSRILLLVDGHQLNENIYDAANLGAEFPIDVDLIDRVEVIRGPNSSLYLASAFLGVINIITKRGRDLRNVSASGELASFDTYKGRLSYGNRFANGLEMLLSGSYYNSQGHDRLYFKEFDNPATGNGIAKNADDDESHQLFADLSYGHFTLQGAYGSREKGVPTASFGTVFNDPGTRTVDAQGYLDLQYERELRGAWRFTGRLHYDQYDYAGTYVYDYSASGGPSRVLNKDFGDGKWWGGEAILSRKVFGRHWLTLGSEYRDNSQQDQKNYDLQPYTLYLDDHRSSNVWAVYAQGEIHLRNNLLLNLGLRHDQYSTFGGTTNPRAALIYSPLERTTIKFLYGQAFRAPNAYEMFHAGGGGNEPNPYLRPETVKTTELVWEQYLGNHFQLAVSGFYYPIRALISEQSDPANGLVIYRNSDQVDIRGMDFGLKRKLPWGLEGGVSYSFQNAENKNGKPLSNSPKHVGQANLSVPLIKQKLFASMNLQYVSSRRTLEGNYTGAYVVPNFTLFSRNVLKGWEFSASLYNAFDQVYGDPGAEEHRQDIIFQDGRSFRIKLGYRF